MGVIKKKKDKKEMLPPKAPLASFEVVMHNTTTLTADEQGQFCHALFQSHTALAPGEWDNLANLAREGVRFVISVLPNEEPNDD